MWPLFLEANLIQVWEHLIKPDARVIFCFQVVDAGLVRLKQDMEIFNHEEAQGLIPRAKELQLFLMHLILFRLRNVIANLMIMLVAISLVKFALECEVQVISLNVLKKIILSHIGSWM